MREDLLEKRHWAWGLKKRGEIRDSLAGSLIPGVSFGGQSAGSATAADGSISRCRDCKSMASQRVMLSGGRSEAQSIWSREVTVGGQEQSEIPPQYFVGPSPIQRGP